MLEAHDRATLMKVLEKIPGRLKDLDITISRTDAVVPPSLGVSKGDDVQPLAFNDRASKARIALERELRVYALRVATMTLVPVPHTPVGHAVYLYKYLPGMPSDAPALEGVMAVVKAADEARAAIDRPQERRYTGSCECGTRLFAPTEAAMVRCRACDLEWDVEEVRAWMVEQARERTGTAAELARLLPWFDGRPITSGQIHQWASRGKLHTVSGEGEPRYRVGDVVDLHRASTPKAA